MFTWRHRSPWPPAWKRPHPPPTWTSASSPSTVWGSASRPLLGAAAVARQGPSKSCDFGTPSYYLHWLSSPSSEPAFSITSSGCRRRQFRSCWCCCCFCHANFVLFVDGVLVFCSSVWYYTPSSCSSRGGAEGMFVKCMLKFWLLRFDRWYKLLRRNRID